MSIENGVKVRMFFELVGWKKESLNSDLRRIIDNLRDKLTLYKEEYAEPEEMGDGTYATHVEIEGEFPSIKGLFDIVLLFEPSIIEIIEPSELIIPAGEMQDILADVNSKVSQMGQDIKILSGRLKQAMNSKTHEKPLENAKKEENEDNNKIPKIIID